MVGVLKNLANKIGYCELGISGKWQVRFSFFAKMKKTVFVSTLIFTVRGEKSLAVRELVQDTYRARSEAANPILFEF
jgi:hypothetical protein